MTAPPPVDGAGGQAGGGRGARPVGRPVRVLDGAAGLLAAGLLIVGVGLLVARVAAPGVLDAVGWGRATGPPWTAVAAHLTVGGVGELVVRRRSRWPVAARAAADSAVIVVGLVVVAMTWWP